jgi:hypothetical protein
MALILSGDTGVPVTTVTGTLPVANGGSGVTTSTGTGAVVLGTSPTITGATITVAATAAPAFSAYYAGGSQTPAANTFTKLIFNTEDFDTNSNFDSTTNYRFTPTVAGYYQINLICNVGQNGSITTDYVSFIYKNGSAYSKVTNSHVASGGYGNQSFSIVIYFNGTTDYVEAYINPTNTGYYPSGIRSLAFTGSLIRSA